MALFPAPIKADTYLESIRWGKIGTVEEAAGKQEFARMLTIYEAFGAVQQPLKYRSGREVWEVRFPPGSRWSNGPEMPSAFEAMVENYVRNHRFAGYMDSTEAKYSGDVTIRKLEELHDATVQRSQQAAEELRQEAHERVIHTLQGAS